MDPVLRAQKIWTWVHESQERAKGSGERNEERSEAKERVKRTVVVPLVERHVQRLLREGEEEGGSHDGGERVRARLARHQTAALASLSGAQRATFEWLRQAMHAHLDAEVGPGKVLA